MGPEHVVLEMCKERYEDELSDIIAHPNYDRTMNYLPFELRLRHIPFQKK